MRVLRYWWFGLGAASLVGTLAALGAGAALAQPSPGPVPTYPECTKKLSPQDNKLTKNAHKLATSYYDRADYDKAIEHWNEALKFDCSVNDLLINIANAYEKNGDKAATVATLEAYLKRTGPNAILEQKVQKLKAALAPPAPTVTAAPTIAPTATAAPTVTATAAPTTTAAPTPEGPRPYGITPWYVVGGGGAVAIAGAILLGVGASQVSSAANACGPSHVCTGPSAQSNADQGNLGRTLQGVGAVALPVGVAAAAGGLVWHFMFNKPGPVRPAKTGLRNVWVSPAGDGRGRSGVMVGGSF